MNGNNPSPAKPKSSEIESGNTENIADPKIIKNKVYIKYFAIILLL